MKTLRLTVIGFLLATVAACSQAPLEPGESTGLETVSEAPAAQSSEEPSSAVTETEVADEAADPEVTEEESPVAVESKTPAATAEAATKKPAPTPSSTQTAAPSPSPTPSETMTVSGYTKAQVAQKNSRTACWAIVSGSVYNLTDWINKHPGGAGAIASLCGTDATASFDAQHGGQARPSSTLEAYYLGPLLD